MALGQGFGEVGEGLREVRDQGVGDLVQDAAAGAATPPPRPPAT
ncbi:hypothetical protein [Streptomyces sp. MK37H]|nr:hypothetical protein [Streptomyces sp. MK37H]